jgi:hypothetical protein
VGQSHLAQAAADGMAALDQGPHRLAETLEARADVQTALDP